MLDSIATFIKSKIPASSTTNVTINYFTPLADRTSLPGPKDYDLIVLTGGLVNLIEEENCDLWVVDLTLS